MSALLALVVFVLVMAIHEFGHAWEMKKCGVEIEEIGIGIPIRRLPHIAVPVRMWGMDIRFTFNLLLFGAYVKPSKAGFQYMQTLPHKTKHLVYAGGIVANTITLSVVSAILYFLSGINFVFLLVVVGIGFLCVFARQFMSSYLFPFVGLLMIGLVAYSLAAMPVTESFAGPVGIVSVVNDKIAESETVFTMLKNFLWMLALISVVLATTNCLPIYPLDGGQIVDSYLQSWGWSEGKVVTFRIVSFAALFTIFALAMYSDAMRIFKMWSQ